MNGTARRYDLDWLRIGATYLLFPFHVAKVFDVLPMYHIKNAQLSPRLDYFTLFVHQWHMPLFFALAGWSAHASMRRRGTSGFLRERVRRLLVPFLAGSLLLCPFLKYLELSSGLSITASGAAALAAPYRERFLDFLPSFYTRPDRFTWSHLWFLLYLFTFSVLYAPLLAHVLSRPRRGRTSTARLYVPLVPLIVVQTTLRFWWPDVQNLYDDWANVAYYSIFFMLGFAAAREPAWEDAIAREWKRAGAIGLGAAAAMMIGWSARGGVRWPVEPTAGAIVTALPLQALSGIAGYTLVIAIWGAARPLRCRTNAACTYLTESSLPVYVLHQLAIVAPGFLIIRLAWSIAAKLALLLVVSVVATMVVYHLVVRPVGPLRAMLGMGARPMRNPYGRAAGAAVLSRSR